MIVIFCRRCSFLIKQHQGHVTKKEQTIADSMAIVDHKWEMRVEVGRGAFAIVELVRHPKNDIAMILKTVSKDKYEKFRENPQVSLTHANEICILQTLDHTRIIKLRWFEEDEVNVYMTFDYMEGGDLLADIMLHGLLPEEFGRSHAVQLCEGLLYLDLKRVVHRDMEPENVLLDRIHREHRHIRIADFGVSRFCGSKEKCFTICGTPMFMAPEVYEVQRGNSNGYDKSVDVWGLGAVLYVMLSGLPPFDEERNLVHQIMKGEYDFEDEQWKFVSDAGQKLVTKLLCVQVLERISVHAVLRCDWLSSRT